MGEQVIISPEEPAKQLRRIFRDQIWCALEELESGQGAHQSQVHAARKQLKKARATLRFLRASLGDEVYRRENAAVRDPARTLSSIRDSEILLDTFDDLVARYPHEFEAEGIEQARCAIKAHRRQLAEASRSTSIPTIRTSLGETQRRASRWLLKGADWPTVLRGLRRTYRAGRAGLRASRSDPSTEVLHDWRKQAKYLWHQLQMLCPVAIGEIGALSDEYHRLSTYLGDDHDLAVLEDKLSELKVPTDSKLSTSLTTSIERRRRELRAKAFALGEHLYGQNTDHFANRMNRLWEDWSRTDKRTAAAHRA